MKKISKEWKNHENTNITSQSWIKIVIISFSWIFKKNSNLLFEHQFLVLAHSNSSTDLIFRSIRFLLFWFKTFHKERIQNVILWATSMFVDFLQSDWLLYFIGQGSRIWEYTLFAFLHWSWSQSSTRYIFFLFLFKFLLFIVFSYFMISWNSYDDLNSDSEPWISHFCGLRSNEYLVQVLIDSRMDESYYRLIWSSSRTDSISMAWAIKLKTTTKHWTWFWMKIIALAVVCPSMLEIIGRI